MYSNTQQLPPKFRCAALVTTAFIAIGMLLPTNVMAQSNIYITGVGQYGGGGATVADAPNAGIFLSLNIDTNQPCTAGVTAGKTRVSSRFDIAGNHSRRKEIMNMAMLAIATGRPVTIVSDSCLTIGTYVVPTISDSAGAQGWISLQ